MGHVHAELMAQYAEDARGTDKPWKLWEYRCHGQDEWKPFRDYLDGGFWEEREYRRKPRTITINGREVPEPMREAPDIGKEYYIAATGNEDMFVVGPWEGDRYDCMRLSRGLCHSTKEAAIAHAEALLSFTEVK